MKLTPNEIEKYIEVQNISRSTINHLKGYIKGGLTEKEIFEETERYLRSEGVNSFWYYGLPALVFVGERTTVSISGRDYEPTDIKVQSEDLITVDFGHQIDDYWGDLARSFVVSGGKTIGINSDELGGCSDELIDGVKTEEKLHSEFRNIISEKNSFQDIFIKMNELIDEMGYENLDFKNNLGHTIEKDMNDRLYIENGNKTKFKDVNLFTFEPHIKKRGGKYGFKREDIYYFKNGVLTVI